MTNVDCYICQNFGVVRRGRAGLTLNGFVEPVAWTVRPPCGEGVPWIGVTPLAKGLVPVGAGCRGCNCCCWGAKSEVA